MYIYVIFVYFILYTCVYIYIVLYIYISYICIVYTGIRARMNDSELSERIINGDVAVDQKHSRWKPTLFTANAVPLPHCSSWLRH